MVTTQLFRAGSGNYQYFFDTFSFHGCCEYWVVKTVDARMYVIVHSVPVHEKRVSQKQWYGVGVGIGVARSRGNEPGV